MLIACCFSYVASVDFDIYYGGVVMCVEFSVEVNVVGFHCCETRNFPILLRDSCLVGMTHNIRIERICRRIRIFYNNQSNESERQRDSSNLLCESRIANIQWCA